MHDDAIQKLIATVLLTPRDAALMYYGEELGMRTNTPTRVEDVRDPIGRIGWPQEKGRDGERTPMQWNNDTNAGFGGTHKPWLPVGPNYKTVNVAVESKEPDSLLNYYKKLIKLRKENEQLRDGDFVLTDEKNLSVLSYVRIDARWGGSGGGDELYGTPQMMSCRFGEPGRERAAFEDVDCVVSGAARRI